MVFWLDVNGIGGARPLVVAASGKHEAVVEALLAREDLNVNAGHPLYVLSDNDKNVPMMRLLMSRNDTDMNQRGGTGSSSTPLSLAVTNKAWKVVDFLLEHDDLDMNTGSPLYTLANSDENLPLLRRLINRNGTDVNQMGQQSMSQTPFYRALYKQAWGVVDLFLKREDLDVNTNTPLYRLSNAREGTKRFEILQRLVARNGTDVNQRWPSNKHTPLFRALYHGNWPVVNLLYSHPKIDLNAQDNEGNTLLLYLIQRNSNGKHDKAIRWALEASIGISYVLDRFKLFPFVTYIRRSQRWMSTLYLTAVIEPYH